MLIPHFRKIRKSTISETIINQIIDMITQGIIKPGQRLPSERELAELMSVSRPSVREAMHALQYMGIIEIRSGEGTYLNKDSTLVTDHFKLKYLLYKYSVIELRESRKILEKEIVSLAVERATEEDKNYLKQAFNQTLNSQDDAEQFFLAGFDFHLALARAAHNEFLAVLLSTTRDLLIEEHGIFLREKGQIKQAVISHEKILYAILEGKKEEATNEMMLHLKMIEDACDREMGGDIY